MDSTAQAQAYIGKPSSADMWIEYYRQEALKSYGIDPQQVTVTFDHPNPDVTFRVSSGRDISRDSDGFYHCTPAEWESVRSFKDAKLIDSF